MKVFKDAALKWLEITFNFQTETSDSYSNDNPSTNGVGGFQAWMPTLQNPNEPKWQTFPGLLEGSAGIGLALLSMISEQRPVWDGCLLFDI